MFNYIDMTDCVYVVLLHLPIMVRVHCDLSLLSFLSSDLHSDSHSVSLLSFLSSDLHSDSHSVS